MHFLKKVYLFSLLFSLVFTLSLCAQETVSKIEIEGNKVISTSTVVSNIKMRANQPYNENIINSDIKTLMGLGYFENVEVEKLNVLGGTVIRFIVKEKPIVKKITVEGARRINRKRLEELIDLKEGTFLDELRIKEAVEKVKDLYLRKGFSQIEVTYQIDRDSQNNEAVVNFDINEKGVARVRTITVQGNTVFSDKRIKKLMKTRQAWFFRKGIFKQELLEDDIRRIQDFYVEQGFSEVKVNYSWNYEGPFVVVDINVNEGVRYHVGEVTFQGNENVFDFEIVKVINLKPGETYNKNKIERQALEIQSLYFDRGYIFAQIKPLSVFNPQSELVDITFQIQEGNINYVEMVYIQGNQRTKDKVIRRELRIYPGDKFEGTKIKKSRQRLENLGFFEEVRFDTEPGTKPDWQNLVVDVKEAKTGYFSFGGGYSSINEFIGFIELRQRNFDYKNWNTFTGDGQDLSLYASFGTLSESYELSFTKPWIFDTPVSFGFDVYKREHEREEDVGYAYHSDTTGGALRLAKEFSDTLKGGIAYRIENVKIDDVVDTATAALKAEEGENDLSSIELSLQWDTRDNVFNPSEGFYFTNSFQFTGGFMGGDKDFNKLFSRFSVYLPLFKKSVFELRTRVGLADPFDNTDTVPIYERFFAGGASTIRGYNERKIGPIDPVTEDPIGGEALFVYNVEYTYPLTDFLKVAGFFDSGDVWAERKDFLSGGLKSSVGVGLRIKTPLGPIDLDYGWPLDNEPGEEGKQGRFHFNISRGF
ncbi:MAG: outer membrane protein assembly factor BamA [Candidatus Omnitrophica bacterium]|nr:outer membrane protein assembly factor BamA [Candidatus Omnitrophota bacterium]